MSSGWQDADVAAIMIHLSPERLATLVALTGSPRVAIELHQDAMRLNASLMTVIASLELALRNTVCENLTTHFGTPGWLTHPPAPFQWRPLENRNAQKALDSARRSEYAKMKQAAKAELDRRAFPQGRPSNTTHKRRATQRQRQIQVSDGKVVAEITLHFWKRLFSREYEQTLWRTSLKRIFPNKTIKRPHIAEKLEIIYQSRNRIAHHESVLYKRFDDTMAAVQFVSQNLGAELPSADSPVAKLIHEDAATAIERAARLHERIASFRT